MRDGIPDVAFLNLQYRSGVVALVHVSWLSPVKLRRTVVVGDRKMLVYDDTAPVEKVKVFDHGAEFKEPESFAEFQMVYRTGDIVSPKIDNAEPLRLEAEHFLHCIGTGAQPDHRRRDGPARGRRPGGRRCLLARRRPEDRRAAAPARRAGCRRACPRRRSRRPIPG